MWLDLRKAGFHAQLQIFKNTNITVTIWGVVSWHSYMNEVVQNHEVAGKDYVNTENSQMTSSVLILAPHIIQGS